MRDPQAKIDANIRLILLKAMYQNANWSANDLMLQAELERFAYEKSLTYIRNQLRWLEAEVSAVRCTTAGSVTIGTLTDAGRDHVERRSMLEGVQRPSSAEA